MKKWNFRNFRGTSGDTHNRASQEHPLLASLLLGEGCALRSARPSQAIQFLPRVLLPTPIRIDFRQVEPCKKRFVERSVQSV